MGSASPQPSENDAVEKGSPGDEQELHGGSSEMLPTSDMPGKSTAEDESNDQESGDEEPKDSRDIDDADEDEEDSSDDEESSLDGFIAPDEEEGGEGTGVASDAEEEDAEQAEAAGFEDDDFAVMEEGAALNRKRKRRKVKSGLGLDDDELETRGNIANSNKGSKRQKTGSTFADELQAEADGDAEGEDEMFEDDDLGMDRYDDFEQDNELEDFFRPAGMDLELDGSDGEGAASGEGILLAQSRERAAGSADPAITFENYETHEDEKFLLSGLPEALYGLHLFGKIVAEEDEEGTPLLNEDGSRRLTWISSVTDQDVTACANSAAKFLLDNEFLKWFNPTEFGDAAEDQVRKQNFLDVLLGDNPEDIGEDSTGKRILEIVRLMIVRHFEPSYIRTYRPELLNPDESAGDDNAPLDEFALQAILDESLRRLGILRRAGQLIKAYKDTPPEEEITKLLLTKQISMSLDQVADYKTYLQDNYLSPAEQPKPHTFASYVQLGLQQVTVSCLPSYSVIDESFKSAMGSPDSVNCITTDPTDDMIPTLMNYEHKGELGDWKRVFDATVMVGAKLLWSYPDLKETLKSAMLPYFCIRIDVTAKGRASNEMVAQHEVVDAFQEDEARQVKEALEGNQESQYDNVVNFLHRKVPAKEAEDLKSWEKVQQVAQQVFQYPYNRKIKLRGEDALLWSNMPSIPLRLLEGAVFGPSLNWMDMVQFLQLERDGKIKLCPYFEAEGIERVWTTLSSLLVSDKAMQDPQVFYFTKTDLDDGNDEFGLYGHNWDLLRIRILHKMLHSLALGGLETRIWRESKANYMTLMELEMAVLYQKALAQPPLSAEAFDMGNLIDQPEAQDDNEVDNDGDSAYVKAKILVCVTDQQYVSFVVMSMHENGSLAQVLDVQTSDARLSQSSNVLDSPAWEVYRNLVYNMISSNGSILAAFVGARDPLTTNLGMLVQSQLTKHAQDKRGSDISASTYLTNDGPARLIAENASFKDKNARYLPSERIAISLGHCLLEPQLVMPLLLTSRKDPPILRLSVHQFQNFLPVQTRVKLATRAITMQAAIQTLDMPYLSNLSQEEQIAALSVMPGLGPRRARRLVRAFGHGRSFVGHRNDLKAFDSVSEDVYKNSCSFMVWPSSEPAENNDEFLERTRIHPEDQDVAIKLACFALGDVESSDEVLSQFRESESAPQHLEDLDDMRLEELLEDIAEEKGVNSSVLLPRAKLVSGEMLQPIQPIGTQEWTPLRQDVVFKMSIGKPWEVILGCLTRCRVDSITDTKAFLTLEDPILKILNAKLWVQNISDVRVEKPSDRLQKGDCFWGVINEIDMRNYSVSVTTKSSHKSGYRFLTASNAADQQRQQEAQQARHNSLLERTSKHKNYRNYDESQAKQSLERDPSKRFLIVPYGNNPLALKLILRFDKNRFKNFVIEEMEKDKFKPFSIGKKLKLNGSEYEDFDHIAGMFVNKMFRYALQVQKQLESGAVWCSDPNEAENKLKQSEVPQKYLIVWNEELQRYPDWMNFMFLSGGQIVKMPFQITENGFRFNNYPVQQVEKLVQKIKIDVGNRARQQAGANRQ